MKHSTFSADTSSITIHSPASFADHRNDRRHQVLLKIRPPRHGISLDHVSGAFRPKVEVLSNQGTLSLIVFYACRRNHHRHHSMIWICTDEPTKSTEQCHGRSYFSFSLARCRSLTVCPSLRKGYSRLPTVHPSPSRRTHSGRLRPPSDRCLSKGLDVPSPYLRIRSMAGQTLCTDGMLALPHLGWPGNAVLIVFPFPCSACS